MMHKVEEIDILYYIMLNINVCEKHYSSSLPGKARSTSIYGYRTHEKFINIIKSIVDTYSFLLYIKQLHKHDF